MVYVVLRNGKVLQYNSGGVIAVEAGTITVRTRPSDPEKKEWLVARIPLDIVERAEFDPPCRIIKSKLTKGRDY